MKSNIIILFQKYGVEDLLFAQMEASLNLSKGVLFHDQETFHCKDGSKWTGE